MAVHTPNGTANSNQSNGSNQSRGHAPQSSARQVTIGGGRFGSVLPRNASGELLNKLKTKIDKILVDKVEDIGKDIVIKTVAVDREGSPLAYSVLAIVIQHAAKKDITAVHLLVIEKSGDVLSPLMTTIAGQQIAITRVPSDALDRVMVTEVNNQVSKIVAGSANNIVIVDATMVPSEFNAEDDNSILDILSNSATAANTEIEIRYDDFKDLNIAETMNAVRTPFVVDVSFERGDVVGVDGLPVRKDVTLQTRIEPSRDRTASRTLNSNQEAKVVTEVGGFVDFMYVGAQPPMFPTQKFVPNFVITSIKSEEAYTPAMVLLAVLSGNALFDDQHWLQGFKPVSVNSKDINYNDIGALNIEGNWTAGQAVQGSSSGFGVAFDTKAPDFTLRSLNELANILVQPRAMFSIDVPDAGPDTWFTSVFRYAAHGDQEANRRIIKAANDLTNGTMAKYFGNGPVFANQGERIHLGYFIDRTGKMRDIRNADYLAFANAVKDLNLDPSLLARYTNTFTQTAVPIEIRMADREMLYNHVFQEVKIKSMGTRLMFGADFHTALLSAALECNYSPIVKTLLNSVDFLGQRAVPTWFNAAAVSNAPRFGHTGSVGNAGFYTPGFNGNGYRG